MELRAKRNDKIVAIHSIEEMLSNDSVTLPPMGSWPECAHVFDDDSIWAIRAALAAKRPLLLRGDPGTGKSQLARAAAVVTNRAFVYSVITARTEPQDLQWRYDAVARLVQAQLCGTLPQGVERDTMLKATGENNFVQPGPLWWALDMDGACTQAGLVHASVCGQIQTLIWKPAQWAINQGSVLLIDEIDKADVDVPNSLLEVLGNNSFTVPFSGQTVKPPAGAPSPLVIVTTNEEREMPWAFVRRCLVHQLALPGKEGLIEWLVGRGTAHFPEVPTALLEKAAELIHGERYKDGAANDTPPGQAEFIDIVRAIKEMDAGNNNINAMLGMLGNVKKFVLNKKVLERT
jgi:MoxR-like ATPase